MSDMSRAGIEVGPVSHRAGSWEDDEPGDKCSACGGYGDITEVRGDHEIDHECPICGGTGWALGMRECVDCEQDEDEQITCRACGGIGAVA